MGMGRETGDKAETEYQGTSDPQKIKFQSFHTPQYLSFFGNYVDLKFHLQRDKHCSR